MALVLTIWSQLDGDAFSDLVIGLVSGPGR